MELVLSTTQAEPPPIYRPRQPRATPLYQLFEAHYEEVKALWEQRFEKMYGFWRGFVDTVVNRYLDCGTRRCDDCHDEKLLTFRDPLLATLVGKLDPNELDYVLGVARNSRLERAIARQM
jgi:hypothetical protein